MNRLAFLLLLAACGDDQTLAPPPPWTPPDLETAYDAPADFDRSMCGASAMGGVDLQGHWRLTVHVGAYGASWSTLDVDERDVNLGYFDATLDLGDHEAFVRAAHAGVVDALLLCHVTADGHLAGRFATCSSEGCSEWPVVAGRRGPIQGEDEAEGLVLVGELATQDTAVNVRVRDGLAYLATEHGLEILDVADPAHPFARGSVPGSFVSDIHLFDGGDGRPYALLVADRSYVVDVSDPEVPVTVSTLTGGNAAVVETRNGHTRAYVSEYGVAVYDLDDPGSPRRLGTYELPAADAYGGSAQGLVVEEGRVYVAYADRGLVVVDIPEDPANARLAGRFMDYPYRASHAVSVTEIDGCKVAAHGDEGPHGHLRVVGVDETCPSTFLRQRGETATRSDETIDDVRTAGTRVYASYNGDGLRVWDVADPAAPRALGYFNTYTWTAWAWSDDTGGAVGLDLDPDPDARLVYVADTVRGLLILRETF